jgi:hypothetical protein
MAKWPCLAWISNLKSYTLWSRPRSTCGFRPKRALIFSRSTQMASFLSLSYHARPTMTSQIRRLVYLAGAILTQWQTRYSQMTIRSNLKKTSSCMLTTKVLKMHGLTYVRPMTSKLPSSNNRVSSKPLPLSCRRRKSNSCATLRHSFYILRRSSFWFNCWAARFWMSGHSS